MCIVPSAQATPAELQDIGVCWCISVDSHPRAVFTSAVHSLPR